MFTKRETNICKGIAIILMLFHHLFNDVEEYAGYIVNYWPFTGERILFFASLAKICVAIFVFLSGYGIAATYDKTFSTKEPDTKESSHFIQARYLKLMVGYWFVFILTLLCQPLGRTIFDAYGTDFKEMFLYFIVDVFGLSHLLGTPSLNPTWWYMSIAICILVFEPFIIRIMRRYGYLNVLCACMMGLFLIGSFTTSNFYLFSMLLGTACYETHFFDVFDRFIKNSIRNKIVISLLEIVCFLVLLSYRTNYNFHGLIDGLLALDLACIVHTFLSDVPILSTLLQEFGKHSANMFLTHNQLYSFYFLGFFYSFKHWSLILIILVLITFLLSVLIEFVKEKSHYNKFIKKTLAI